MRNKCMMCIDDWPASESGQQFWKHGSLLLYKIATSMDKKRGKCTYHV